MQKMVNSMGVLCCFDVSWKTDVLGDIKDIAGPGYTTAHDGFANTSR